ncbi:hypothetical protein MCEMKE14_00130 [Candidatus Nanopelagicaceae bacterium]
MSRYALKFPRRVRIHGGEFDESARAIHREDGLKTIQAESGIVLGSTIERKQMSTKTTFKRVALVAVAALGFGVMSVAPSNAATGVYIWHGNYASNGNCNAAASYACSDVIDDTSWVIAGQPASYGFQQTFSAVAAADSVSSTWSLTSAASSAGTLAGWEVPTLALAGWNGAIAGKAAANVAAADFTGEFDTTGDWGFVSDDEPYSSAAKLAAAQNATTAVAGYTATTTAAAAGGTIGNVKTTFTPAVAGTYVFTLTTTGGTTHTWTIKAYANQLAMDAGKGIDQALNTGKTTSILNSGETDTATLATETAVTKSMALSATSAATIKVTPKNAADAAIPAQTISVTVAGPGTVAIATTLSAANALSVGTGRAVTAAAAGDYYVAVFADGTPGVSTIKISVGTTVIGEEKVTFYGAAATITPKVVKTILARGANAGAITAIVTDAAGVPVKDQEVWSLSDTDANVDNTPVSCGTSDATGLVSCGITGDAAGAGTAKISLMNASTLAASTVTAVAGTVRVSDGTATNVAYSFDQATYAPGETAKITAKVTNAAGLMPGGVTYTLHGGVTGNYSIGTLPAGVIVPAGDTGSLEYSVVMPTGISGTVKLIATALDGKTVTLGEADVVNEALDAALEAIDAATNAETAATAAIEAASDAEAAADLATEAAVEAGELAVAAAEAAGEIAQGALDAASDALTAAEDAKTSADEAKASADEATVAATAAGAAVEALSTKVATLIAGLNAKVTTLSNLLAKIAKKLNVK